MDNFNYISNYNDYIYDYDYDYENVTIFEEFGLYHITYWPTYRYVIPWIVISIGFPLTLLAIYALYLLVQNDHVAPVYVINLLISDLVQMCCLLVAVASPINRIVLYLFNIIYFICVMASVGFMVCIALERYLVIACPLWYRFKRSVHLSVWVSIMIWALSVTEGVIAVLTRESTIIRCVFLLLPFPLLIFSLAGTLKPLSASTSVPVKEKRRIVGTLVLVLLNYTVLFLPMVILLLSYSYPLHFNNPDLGLAFLQFSPLADLVLYVFMRKGAVDKMLARMCCCRLTREEEQGQIPNQDNNITEEDVSSV